MEQRRNLPENRWQYEHIQDDNAILSAFLSQPEQFNAEICVLATTVRYSNQGESKIDRCVKRTNQISCDL